MKHKAQESLDTLECRVYTADGEICDINLQLGRCNGCDFKGALKDVQDLINCQLTKQEIDKIIMCLAFPPFELLNEEQERVVLDKLLKQKEMGE